VAPPEIRLVKIDRVSGKRVFAGDPTNDPKSSIIWEAFKADSEPPRVTRQDELAAQRDAVISAIKRGAAAAQKQAAPETPAAEDPTIVPDETVTTQ
jgi:penicillin-binding protein 1A